MAVTKILFKQGSTDPKENYNLNLTVGEPLWYQPYSEPEEEGEEAVPKGPGILYVTNGQGADEIGPTMIGPIEPYTHPTKTLTNGTYTTANNSTHTITATEGYAISKITVDSAGHVSSADAVIMPTGGSGMTAHTLSGQYHSDVNAGSPSANDVLAWNGTDKWVNASIARILSVTNSESGKILTNNGTSVSWTPMNTGVNTDVWADDYTSISVNGEPQKTVIIDHYAGNSPSDHGNSKGARLMGSATTNEPGTAVEFSVSKAMNSIVDVECKINVIFGGTW